MNDDLKTAMNEFRAARAALQAFAPQPVNPAVVAPLFSAATLDEWNVARVRFTRAALSVKAALSGGQCKLCNGDAELTPVDSWEHHLSAVNFAAGYVAGYDTGHDKGYESGYGRRG